MKAAVLLTLAIAVLGGCFPTTRPAMMEFSDDRGDWVVEVRGAQLEMDGWSLAVMDSEVGKARNLPQLQKLVLEITNTSRSEPLVLEPDEIFLEGLRAAVPLGPYRTIVLAPGDSAVMEYDPGRRAPIVAYPFVVKATVFRGEGFEDPQTAELALY